MKAVIVANEFFHPVFTQFGGFGWLAREAAARLTQGLPGEPRLLRAPQWTG